MCEQDDSSSDLHHGGGLVIDGPATSRRHRAKIVDGVIRSRPDTLVAEESLEMRVAGTYLSTTTRTPGNNFDLAASFPDSEGIVRGADQLASNRYCAGADDDGRIPPPFSTSPRPGSRSA